MLTVTLLVACRQLSCESSDSKQPFSLQPSSTLKKLESRAVTPSFHKGYGQFAGKLTKFSTQFFLSPLV